jgi:FAD/FMN-containing dehydrogenase
MVLLFDLCISLNACSVRNHALEQTLRRHKYGVVPHVDLLFSSRLVGFYAMRLIPISLLRYGATGAYLQGFRMPLHTPIHTPVCLPICMPIFTVRKAVADQVRNIYIFAGLQAQGDDYSDLPPP